MATYFLNPDGLCLKPRSFICSTLLTLQPPKLCGFIYFTFHFWYFWYVHVSAMYFPPVFLLCYIQNLKTQISIWGKSKYCVEQQNERSWEESESLDFSFTSISLTPIDSPAALWPHPLLESLVWCDGVSDLGEEDSLCRVYCYWLECKVVGVAILNWDTHYWLSFLNC